MADNVDITPGTGQSVAADDVGNVAYQRIKLTGGADGVAGRDILAGKYAAVAASSTATLGTTGASGDYLAGLVITPLTTSPGPIAIVDNVTTSTVFAGGASSVSNLVPFPIQLGIYSTSSSWKVLTSTNASVIAIGNFT